MQQEQLGITGDPGTAYQLKFYIGHIPGLKKCIKTLGSFKKGKAKFIDEELEKSDTRKVVIKRVVLNFEPYDQRGYDLTELNKAPDTAQSSITSQGHSKLLYQKPRHLPITTSSASVLKDLADRYVSLQELGAGQWSKLSDLTYTLSETSATLRNEQLANQNDSRKKVLQEQIKNAQLQKAEHVRIASQRKHVHDQIKQRWLEERQEVLTKTLKMINSESMENLQGAEMDKTMQIVKSYQMDDFGQDQSQLNRRRSSCAVVAVTVPKLQGLVLNEIGVAARNNALHPTMIKRKHVKANESTYSGKKSIGDSQQIENGQSMLFTDQPTKIKPLVTIDLLSIPDSEIKFVSASKSKQRNNFLTLDRKHIPLQSITPNPSTAEGDRDHRDSRFQCEPPQYHFTNSRKNSVPSLKLPSIAQNPPASMLDKKRETKTIYDISSTPYLSSSAPDTTTYILKQKQRVTQLTTRLKFNQGKQSMFRMLNAATTKQHHSTQSQLPNRKMQILKRLPLPTQEEF